MKLLAKGIDAQAVLQGALRNKDKIAFVVIMLLALAIAIPVYQRQEAKTEAIQEEIAVEEDRISAGKEWATLSKEIAKKAAAYFRGKDSLGESLLRGIASLNSIKILSFSQAEEGRGDLLSSELFDFEARGEYHNLARFVSSLESRGGHLQIENISLKNTSDSIDDGNDDSEDLFLAMRIRVKYIKAQ